MKTILVIDDDEPILAIYGMTLEHAGYRVLTTSSGAEGVELARRNLPDLILCDINMPGMDGRSVLRSLRDEAEVAAKQIVLMTGNTRAIMPREVMEMGADDFLTKPFDSEALLRCVEARLWRAQVHRRVEDRIFIGLRSRLRSTLPHELFTPLAGMLGLVEVLRGDWPQLQPSEITELLDEIDQSGWRLHRTLKNFLFALDLEDGPEVSGAGASVLAVETVHSSVMAGLEAAVWRHKRKADLTHRIETCEVSGHAKDIAIIVEELVDNACIFYRPGMLIRVHLDSDGTLSVADLGRGMTEEQIRQIGKIRQLDRKKYEQQGLGLGLVIVQKLAARCGAKLTLESQPGSGTTVKVEFARSAATSAD